MLLEGGCHCRSVTFSLQSSTVHPFLQCFCSICRKTAGGGGCCINLGGDAGSMKVEGREHITIYHAVLDAAGKVRSNAERHFCSRCGSALWLWDERWPDLIHPMASAIDTPLPAPPEHVRIMLKFKPDWVELPPNRPGHAYRDFEEYPEESLAVWHRRHKALV